ncbi:hypothetical protein MHYP_G00126430 [Metynnis hypsauchen]
MSEDSRGSKGKSKQVQGAPKKKDGSHSFKRKKQVASPPFTRNSKQVHTFPKEEQKWVRVVTKENTSGPTRFQTKKQVGHWVEAWSCVCVCENRQWRVSPTGDQTACPTSPHPTPA